MSRGLCAPLPTPAGFYSDRSMFIWDVANARKIGRFRSQLAHAGCVWDLVTVPPGVIRDLPDGGFISASSDNTIRLWALPSAVEHEGKPSGAGRRNIFSKDLVKVGGL